MTSLHKLLLSLFVAIVLALPALAQETSSEAQRHMIRGQVAMEDARDVSGYNKAVTEFRKATQLVPDWADAWFNLGVAQEKAGDSPGAVRSYKKYLKLSPDAADRTAVETQIIRLDYRLEQAEQERQAAKTQAQNTRSAEAKVVRSLAGEWRYYYAPSQTTNVYQIKIIGNTIKLTPTGFIRKGKYSSNTCNVVFYEGRIKGLDIEGIETWDYKRCNVDEKGKQTPFKGSISSNGKKIKFRVKSSSSDITLTKHR